MLALTLNYYRDMAAEQNAKLYQKLAATEKEIN